MWMEYCMPTDSYSRRTAGGERPIFVTRSPPLDASPVLGGADFFHKILEWLTAMEWLPRP